MKAATIRDVARRADVSVASVSRVLNGADAVTEPTRRRIQQAVQALGYVPHSGARSLSTRRTDTLGVILPDLFGEFFSELIRGMDLAARAAGLHLIVSSSHDDAEQAGAVMRSMRGRVDGLIVLSPHLGRDDLTAGLAPGAPVLMMSGDTGSGDLPSIVIDNHAGARAAVEHLIAQGRRRIVHARGPHGNAEADARLAGYVQTMGRAGLETRVETGDFTQPSGRAATERLLAGAGFDAVFAANDSMAVGALAALRAHGLSTPGDVALVGFDDIPLADLVTPGLTTLRIDISGLGRRAVERVVGLIEGETAPIRREVVEPVLIVRASSAAVRQPSPVNAARKAGRNTEIKGEPVHV